jgi:putative nucleotidyltransferase with HDIG domain
MSEWSDREAAFALLTTYTQGAPLIKHALGVEAAMRAYANKYGENPDEWGVVGLLHDFDYERHPTPEEHPYVGVAMLRERGFPEPALQAILGHARYTGVARETLMARALFACDELSGFITAVALVRPSKSIFDVDVASVKKKLKDKAFARGVSRQDVYDGADELGLELDEHISFVIGALAQAADSLGLQGTSA